MIKIKWYIILLSFLFLVSGCRNHSTVNSKIITNLNKQDNSGEIKTIPFEYFFRGFATLRYNQVEAYPHETYIIETDEDWHDFMNKYVPGIPYYGSVDYSKESLVFSVLFPPKPTYSIGADIKTFNVNENKLEPEYIINSVTTGIANGTYAQNVDGIEHCFVNIVKIAKEDIPKDCRNIYHKGDVLKK